MHERFTAVCKRTRKNNGIVEVMFTRQANFADEGSNEEHVLMNVRSERGPYNVGETYSIDIQPASPRKG